MIFMAKNEDGVSTYDLALKGVKKVTRRSKPLPIGKEFAIQCGRGKKAGARAKVISCVEGIAWAFKTAHKAIRLRCDMRELLDQEAKLEGFKSWAGLNAWFVERGEDITEKYRIEYEIVSKGI